MQSTSSDIIVILDLGQFTTAQLPKPGAAGAVPPSTATTDSPSWAIYAFSAGTDAPVIATPLLEPETCVAG